MSEKNFLPTKTNQGLEDVSGTEEILDFLIPKSKIYILNDGQETMDTIETSGDAILGQTIIGKLARNIQGEINDFSYVKIENKNGVKVIPINSNILKNWIFRTANESNNAPVIKIQTNTDGDTVSYARYNGNIEINRKLLGNKD